MGRTVTARMQPSTRRLLCLGAVLSFVTLASTARGQIDAGSRDGPLSPHRLALERQLDSATSPDLLGHPKETIIPLQPRRDASGPCATVFGYLPYWESSANIHWDLLTHVACFSVGVNSDGSLGNDHGWPWTSVINTAHASGVKVILTATQFDPAQTLTLITTPAYKNAFFVNIKNKMLEGSADGLNIDFEGSGSYLAYINGFMADLTAYLHAELPGSEVTFAGPAINWSGWDLPGLAASCDGIFIMGYAFAGSWSNYSGANSPLTGGNYNITTSLLNYYGQVTQNTPEKLILGLPNYGNHWTTTSSAARTDVIDYHGPTWFEDDEPASQVYGVQWETFSQTPWYRWHDGTNWHQVWFDNAESTGLKYELAKQHNLQGVGMWALNYDGAREELWDEIREHFVDACCEDEISTNGMIVFADDFDAGVSGAMWSILASSSDHTAEMAFDYSVHGIPPAPNTPGGTTIGAKFTVNNNDAFTGTEALSAYPLGQSFTADFSLLFDMWINYNGGPGGGAGSTEFTVAGINQSGTQVNWPENASADGVSFAASGEGGAADDYRAYNGPTQYTVASGTYLAGTQDSSDSFYENLFPSPTYESEGAPGKHWVEVEVTQTGSMIEWRLNGTLIARVIGAPVTSGNIMLGYMDPYASLADPAAENFIVYDNVRVVLPPQPDCNENGISDACETIAAGDFDADGFVDLDDFAALQGCLAGPQTAPTPPLPTCRHACREAFDDDADGDVDLQDFRAFQDAFSD